MQLDKVDPQFRITTDLLFFTDRLDIDTCNYQSLLFQNEEHIKYLRDRLLRSMEIFWSPDFWINRFELIYSLDKRKSSIQIENHLISQFSKLITQLHASPEFNNEYIQLMAWCKVKANNKESIVAIREFLLGLVHKVQIHRIPSIIGNFTPFIFKDMTEYVSILSKRVGQSARNLEAIQELEKQGLPVDKLALAKLAKDLLFKRVPNRKNRLAFFALIDNPVIMAELKSEYKPQHRNDLLAIINNCDHREIEKHHLRNIKNLLELDASIAEELVITYADRLYARGTGNRGANVKRLIRACKTFPEFSPKKVLVYLSADKRMDDVKKLVASFHDLKLLVPFI
jgi:hypothetical protein